DGLVETKCLIDRQHRSLESVVLRDAPPETLAALLVGCPYLKRVWVVSEVPVDVRQLLNQPWTCASSLEELSAMPCLPPATEGVDTAMIEKEFMMKLGQCTQLRELMISQHDGEETVQLSWSLAYGLNHLASLSRLEKVLFGGWMYFEVPELQFMREHWPRVKWLPLVKSASNAASTWLQENWPTIDEWLSINDEPVWGYTYVIF
ncbi:hypothetical protein BGW41_005546, partial [Actinomortierella wolfii]